MNLNITLLGQALTFGVFVWFTMRRVWPPLLSAIQTREQTITEGLAAGEQGRRQLAIAQQEAEACMADARVKAQAILTNAQAQAQALLDTAKRQANAQTLQLRLQADQQIAQKWEVLKHQLGAELGKLVIAGTEAALKIQSTTSQAQRQWVQQVIEQCSIR